MPVRARPSVVKLSSLLIPVRPLFALGLRLYAFGLRLGRGEYTRLDPE